VHLKFEISEAFMLTLGFPPFLPLIQNVSLLVCGWQGKLSQVFKQILSLEHKYISEVLVFIYG